MRDHTAITRFFDGLELIEPGVVQPQQWRPEPGMLSPTQVTAWCGVAQEGANADPYPGRLSDNVPGDAGAGFCRERLACLLMWNRRCRVRFWSDDPASFRY